MMKTRNRQTGAALLIAIVFLMVIGSLFVASMSNLSSVSSSLQSIEHTSNVANAAAQSGMGYGILKRMETDRTQNVYCNDAVISTAITQTPCSVKYCSSPKKLNADGTFTVSGRAVCYAGSPFEVTRWVKEDVRGFLLSDGVTFHYQAIPGSREQVAFRFNPEVGPAAGGTTVTITGIHLSHVQEPPPPTDLEHVTFGGTNVASLIVNSDTQLTVTTPPHAVGTVDVTIILSFKGTTELPITFTKAFTYQ